MSLINNEYWQGFDIGATSATTTRGYSNHIYNNGIISDYLLRINPVVKPKKKTFEEKMQSEVDDWLSIFKES